ncbi:phospho-sugar mutase [Microlunatus capsulatus]|uniref:Phosphomannomutase n=1 Tax=Microlunatus capsulatus TaxID=99117 RepID=A0ABS4Z6J8_9ACTN|nr:phospho-sugar mutase [Microlunatus capsulatus]MBP2416400.1 phosphomannomutase [Microlunatus capsulatus]
MSDSAIDDLARTVAAWTAQDPDPATRAEAEERLDRARSGDADARAALADAFGSRLAFGTAGLRGALGAGPNRMNRVVVGQAAAGLAGYLLAHDAGGQRVLVGYDARHGSAVFARDTAEILAAAGFETLLTAAPTPTPVVAFGIRHLGCAAAVVVTASHNPPQDNGYKVYLGDGSQIVPPADAEIAAEIARVAAGDLADVPRSPAYRVVGDELLDAYRDRVASLVHADAPRDLRWVYTPMHGVGGALVEQVVAAAGFPAARVVAAQAEPDPDFPTVPFPNPEEPGAIDLALAEAEAAGADLVVANDPDADRCAAAVVVDGGWRMLSGDELGALLGDDALRRGVRGTYACSVVSSTLLSRLAAASAQPFVATLTGFKWIGRVPGLAFGYEEAIGYCVDPQAVPDKDGISALVRVLALAAELRAHGRTLADRLDEIARVHGVHHTSQLSVRVADLALIGEAMARLRAAPPSTLAGEPVVVEDLAPGSAALPPTDAVLLRGASTQVVVRPSGTEPKLKCYLEVREDPTADLVAARARARDRMAQVRTEMSTALGL